MTYRPGDVVLAHSRLTRNPASWFGVAIRFGQWLYRPTREFRWFNHAALIVSPSGDLVEALGRGITRTHISAYDRADIRIAPVEMSVEDWHQIEFFANWNVGYRYGFATIASIALWLLFRAEFFFSSKGAICSGFVARAMERAGYVFDRPPSHVMPADLARMLGVRP